MLFRNTPRSPTGQTPAKMIFGRDIRDNLPMKKKDLLPQVRFSMENRKEEVQRTREKENNTPALKHSKSELPLDKRFQFKIWGS